MYIYDRKLSGSQYRRDGHSIGLRPSYPYDYPNPAQLVSGGWSERLGQPASAIGLDPAVGLNLLSAFTTPSQKATIPAALSILKLICQYHNIPWRIGFAVLEHEGGIHRFTHHDGVMQTIEDARKSHIPNIPRPLKLTLLGLPLTSNVSDKSLTSTLHGEFRRRLAVQIATGVQELKDKLDKFSGYIALAFAAYNTGSGSIFRLVTRKFTNRPPGIDGNQWEEMCRFGASLLHQHTRDVRIGQGYWLCDPNLRTGKWIPRYGARVYDKQSGVQLIGYQYLRQVEGCAPSQGPSSVCDFSILKKQRVQPGSGPLVCKPTRDGILDKFYNPKKLGSAYYNAAKDELRPIADDGLPIKALDGRLVKAPLMSGAVVFSPVD